MAVALTAVVTILQLEIETSPFGSLLADAHRGQEDAIGRVKLGGRALVLSTSLDVLATMALIVAPGTMALYLLAGLLHLVAGAEVWMGTNACRSRRVFMTALALSLPLVGTLIAALALGTQGQGDIAQFFATEKPRPRATTAEDVRRLTDKLPPCEALLSTDRDERGATFAMLTRQADAAAIRMLRWVVAGQDPDLAVEAALALEDLSTRFEGRAVAARQALQSAPGFENAVAAADTLAEAIHSGLVDPSLVSPLATEARRCYREAESFAPDRMAEVVFKQARLELAVLCPAEALAILDRPGAAGAGGDLVGLRAQAVSSVRRPWAPLAIVQAAA